KRRYEDRLQVSIRCMVDADQVAVPCFTLQPLVENALKYGIEPNEEGGLLEVVIRRRAGSIHISIHDDGPGMSAEQIRRLFDGTETSSDGASGIGIPNVVNRLKLLYKGRERFSIKSSPGHGTFVRLTIPDKGEVAENVSPAHS
ncbi:MAG TPA: ATP-binding protein, partial [Spirochaetia bacterium]|nr:ATP-binding protein [Spirochaetia bacterium]